VTAKGKKEKETGEAFCIKRCMEINMFSMKKGDEGTTRMAVRREGTDEGQRKCIGKERVWGKKKDVKKN